ncbi:MAG: TVP38/TMEM64 family protein [Pseudomonadota bacterium]
MSDMTQPQAPANDAPKKSAIKRFGPLALLVTGAVLGAVFLGDYLNFQTLADNREALLAFRDANYVLLTAIFIVAYAVIIAFALPGAAIASITGGFLFALFPGTLFNMIAATLGATATFLAARYGFGDAAAQKLDASEGVMGRIKKGIDQNQWETLFLIRLLPILPFAVSNVALSVVGLPLWKYVVGTFVGILPGAIVYTWIGAGLSEVFARGETPDLGIIFEPHIMGPILGLAALAVLPILIKTLRGGKQGL